MTGNNIRRKNEIEAALARDAADDARIAAAKVAPYTIATSQSLKQADGYAKTLWSGSLEDVAKRITQTRTPTAGTWAASIARPDESSVEDPLTLGADFAVSFETTATPRPDIGKEAFDEFLNTLPAKTGYTLSTGCGGTGGVQRLLLWMLTQCKTRNLDLSKVSNWAVGFDRLVQLGAFADDELGFDDNLRTPDPEPEPVPYDIETADTTSRDGQRQAQDYLDTQYFSVDARNLFYEWLKSLENGFGFYGADEAFQKAAVGEFTRRNLSMISRQSFDIVRRALAKRLNLEHVLLTRDELFAQSIEDTPGSIGSYKARQDFIRRSSVLREQ
jgi:hypothetical protein